jgi:GNAT superfamily N-acetyltransferase
LSEPRTVHRVGPEQPVARGADLFADLGLARRLEGTHARRAVLYAEAAQRLRPGASNAVEEIGGGYAVYSGADKPVNYACGLGLHGPLGADDVQRLERFYRRRGLAPEAEVCPLADASLMERLGSAGYRLAGFFSVLARTTSRCVAQANDGIGDPVSVRQIGPEQRELWLETVAQGFAEEEPAPEAVRVVIGPNLYSASAAHFLAWIDGEPVGGGAIVAHAGVAELCSDSTRVGFRGRGVQTALLWARLAAAATAGCDLALLLAEPGSRSQRNAERVGFRLAYTKAVLRLAG